MFLSVLVLPVRRGPPFLGEFLEEDLPAKQPTKQILGQLWDSGSFLLFSLTYAFVFQQLTGALRGSVSA